MPMHVRCSLNPKPALPLNSTSSTGQAVLARSVMDVDPQAAVAVMKERNWRFGYGKHFIENVRISLRTPETALKVAQTGLDYMHNQFEFVRDGKVMSLATAMSTITARCVLPNPPDFPLWPWTLAFASCSPFHVACP